MYFQSSYIAKTVSRDRLSLQAINHICSNFSVKLIIFKLNGKFFKVLFPRFNLMSFLRTCYSFKSFTKPLRASRLIFRLYTNSNPFVFHYLNTFIQVLKSLRTFNSFRIILNPLFCERHS